jgi:hypothetical protein
MFRSQFGNIRDNKAANPNNIGGFTAQDGTGATGKMGKGYKGIAANCDSENNRLGSREAHHVRVSPQEDCSGTASKVGEVEGRKEGCVERRLAQWKCTRFQWKTST